MKLNGIGASSGIAIAKVLKLTHQLPTITNQPVLNWNDEITSFHKNVKKTAQQISEIKKVAVKKLGQHEASVFDAHLDIINDPVFQSEVIQLINQQKVNALYAVTEVRNKYVSLFEKMDNNEYMRQRATDVKDVTHRLLNNLAELEVVNLEQITSPVILVSNDITPSETAQMNKEFVLGFATNIGGKTSHAAIMARTLGIPAVLGIKNITEKVEKGQEIALDGDSGLVIINPSDLEKAHLINKQKDLIQQTQQLQKYRHKKSLTKDKVQVELAANIGSLHDLDLILNHDAEAIGLFRSEFLYMDKNNWPTENEQFIAYKTVLEKMQGKLVVIRTLDIGGDKQLNYFKFPSEQNPFLGYRAIRLSLDQPEIFKTQLRALIRASSFGNLAIMFPMIATVDEFIKAKEIFNKVYNDLKAAHYHISDNIQVGMMVEVPAAAIMASQFAQHADFFSIGTNDLMQYSMAHDRMNQKVAYLYQPLNPAILNLINMTIKGAHEHKKWVGMCGEMAGDPRVVPFLIGMQLDEFSMTSNAILKTRAQISKIDTSEAKKLVEKALKMSTSKEVEKLLKNFNDQIT